MPLVTRTYNYVPGALTIASQNNTNEITLFNLLNGNLDADNISSLGESVITFDTSSGHDHDGSNSKTIDLSGAGFLLRAETTGTNHSIIGRSSSSGAHAGLAGIGEGASNYGGFFDHENASGTSLLVEGDGGGSPLWVQNKSGAAGNDSLTVRHRSTTAAKAAILIDQATSTGYGIWIDDVAGEAIRVDDTNASSTDSVVLTKTGGSGDVLIVYGDTTGVNVTSNVDAATNVKALLIETGGGVSAITPDANGWVEIDGTSVEATPTTSTFRVIGNSIHNSTTVHFSQNNGQTAGTASTDSWVLKVTSGGTADQNSVYLGGRVYIDGYLAHGGAGLGFYGTAPITKQTVTGAKAGNVALTNLMTALAALGLLVDSTT
jgi:hypothetical protein